MHLQFASGLNILCFLFFCPRLFAIGSQLSPEVGSSGIEMLETDVFKLHCFQTLTGQCFTKRWPTKLLNNTYRCNVGITKQYGDQ